MPAPAPSIARRARALALAAALPAAAQEAAAQEADVPLRLTCTLATLCLDTTPCRDFEQELTIRGAGGVGGVWQVIWSGTDLPTEYELIADLAPPPGSLNPTRLRSLMFRNLETQSVQVLSFDGTGNLAVSGHQPQAVPRIVTGFGTCEGG